MINDVILNHMRDDARDRLDEKRYLHTVEVEKEAAAIGRLFLPDKVYKLRCAAILHDITKSLSWDNQIRLSAELGIDVPDDPLVYGSIIHGKTAAGYAKLKYEEYVDDEIASAIAYHTTGRAGMSVFESIIYLADFIEPTRIYEDCVKLRSFFRSGITRSQSDEEKFSVFIETLVLSFDSTLRGLIDRRKAINADTVSARNYFISLLEEMAKP